MHIYEMILIIKPQLSDPEVGEFVEKTKKYVGTEGGEMVSEEKMGRKKLAHPIGRAREGFYVYLKFKSPAKLVAKLSQQMRVSEAVLRATIMRSMEKETAKPAPAAAAAAAK